MNRPEEQPYNVGPKRSIGVAPFLEMYCNQQLRKKYNINQVCAQCPENGKIQIRIFIYMM